MVRAMLPSGSSENTEMAASSVAGRPRPGARQDPVPAGVEQDHDLGGEVRQGRERALEQGVGGVVQDRQEPGQAGRVPRLRAAVRAESWSFGSTPVLPSSIESGRLASFEGAGDTWGSHHRAGGGMRLCVPVPTVGLEFATAVDAEAQDVAAARCDTGSSPIRSPSNIARAMWEEIRARLRTMPNDGMTIVGDHELCRRCSYHLHSAAGKGGHSPGSSHPEATWCARRG